ncbi:MAG: epoxyqueuosine reductase QueH [Thermosipho sp. (in: Bacteria)]|nr:epoxyqueuosine reductase QueH [Thermosipho sp. (in: thermotogales)]
MLLHVCCAPDLVPAYFHLSSIKNIYFYNPNIYPEKEFNKRFEEVKKLAFKWNLKVVNSDYEPNIFYEYVKGLEDLGENSQRCEKCIYLRLKKTAIKAKEIGENSFATTLTASPRKILKQINNIGKIVEKETGIKYIETYFRKGNEYQKALKFIKENSIYRQDYCGCIFSLKEKELKKKEDIENRKNKLKELGFDNFDLNPEELFIDEQLYKKIKTNFTIFIELIKPKLLLIDENLAKELNLKEGWNKLIKYNLKVKYLR